MTNHGFRGFGILLVALISCVAAGASSASSLSARQILDRAERPYNLVSDYTVDVCFSMDSSYMHIPEMKAKIFYKKPDKVQIKGKDGFAALPKHGLVIGNPIKLFFPNAGATIKRSGRAFGRDCWVLKSSHSRKASSDECLAWIDKKDFTLLRVTAESKHGPRLDMDFRYSGLGERYHLPASTTARFSSPVVPNKKYKDNATFDSATMKIEFSNYLVNTGLKDSIFVKHK